MKKIMLFAAFAAALTLSSCKKEIKNDEPAALRTIHFNAIPSETKTVFGNKSGTKYPVLWQDGDKICPSFNWAAPNSANYITVTPSSGGTSASFDGQVPESESYQFIFISPAATFKSINKSNQTVMVEIPSGQTSTAAYPDPAAQILYANTGELNSIPSPVALNFGHLTAYLHMTFTNVNLGTATVLAVNITNDDQFIAGRVFFHVDDGSYTESTGATANTISVATSQLVDVWCALCPCDLSGKQLTIEVSTDQGTFTKTVNMPASANLTRGKIAKFTVNMSGVPLVAPVVYKAITNVNQLNVGDKVIIAAAGEDQPFAMSTGQNTNNRSAAGVSKTAEEIVNPTDAVEIFQIEDGVIPGHYAFKATGVDNPGYIYAANSASSGSNILKTQATMDNSASWAVSVEDVKVGSTTWEKASRIFADIPSSGRGLLRFNSSDKLFTAYGNGTTMEAVRIYRLDEPADNTPRFNVTMPNTESSVPSAGAQLEVYVFGNVHWTAAVNVGTLTPNSGTGAKILTWTIPANTSGPDLTPEVTVSTTEAVNTQSYSFTKTQKKTATFPLSWTFPAESSTWVADTDFKLVDNGLSGSYVYSDNHYGKITVFRGTTNSTKPTYKNETIGGISRIMFGHYGMNKGAYWLFELFEVNNPAGKYTINYSMSSSNAGPKFYTLKYSVDGGNNWDSFGTQTKEFIKNGGSKVNITYSYELSPGNTNSEVVPVSKEFTLSNAFSGTLLIKAEVTETYRATYSGSYDGIYDMANTSGGINRIVVPPTISFTAAE